MQWCECLNEITMQYPNLTYLGHYHSSVCWDRSTMYEDTCLVSMECPTVTMVNIGSHSEFINQISFDTM